MGLMALKLATLNARLLGELSNLSVNVAAVQKTHFNSAAVCQMLEVD